MFYLKVQSQSIKTLNTNIKKPGIQFDQLYIHSEVSYQIKSNHFYCHITTAQVPW